MLLDLHVTYLNALDFFFFGFGFGFAGVFCIGLVVGKIQQIVHIKFLRDGLVGQGLYAR